MAEKLEFGHHTQRVEQAVSAIPDLARMSSPDL